MNIIIKSTLIFSFIGLSTAVFSQSAVKKSDDKKVEKIEKSVTPTELKSTPETSYLINDKPVSREKYMEYLLKKEEGVENNSPK